MFVWAFFELNPQVKFVKEHFGNQYPRKPWLAPLGIAAGLACALLVLVGAVTGGFNSEKQLVFNNGELHYVLPVTDAEANRFGEFLLANHVFNGDRKTVEIKKVGSVYQFRMVVNKGTEKDEKYASICKMFCGEISRSVFGGAPVTIHLCDDHLNTVRVIEP